MGIKYFSNFPYLTYTLNDGAQSPTVIATNVFRRVQFLESLKNDSQVFYPYTVKDGDTPEVIAHKFYGSADYYWVITLFNNILDPILDWPKPSQTFERYLIYKYGSIEIAKTTIHHYTKTIIKVNSLTGTTSRTYTIDKDTYDSLTSLVPEVYTFPHNTVTISTERNIVYTYEYEQDANELKRNIKLLKQDYISRTRAQLETLTQ